MGINQDKMADLLQRFGANDKKENHQTEDLKNVPSPHDGDSAADPRFASFKEMPAFKRLEVQKKVAIATGIAQPFFVSHEGRASSHTRINGRDCLNFSSYDYLGLNGDPRVNEAAAAAMQRYGTSAGASRLVAGQRPVHDELERALALHYGVESAIVFVSGYVTNVNVISTLFGREDIIFEDRLCHNSIVTGSLDSRAFRVVFEHNDPKSLKDLLQKHRARGKRALIVTEGVFSMDGNFAALEELVALKKEFGAFLMVDEAHALGVAGKKGLGSFEKAGIDPTDVDIWMGTLSKTLCTCGGFIAGSSELIELLKYMAPGFVYSVGISPVLAAASLKALELLHEESFRVAKLQENADFALKTAQNLGLNTGMAQGSAIIPIIVGSSMAAAFLSNLLMEEGICALPIIYPVVPEGEARLRLFLSASHDKNDLKTGLEKIASLIKTAFDKERDFIKPKNPED